MTNMRNRFSRLLSFILLIIAMLTCSQVITLCKTSFREQRSKECGFSEVYQYGGWLIPGLEGAIPEKKIYTISDAPGVIGIRLRTTKFGQHLTILNCDSSHFGRLVYRSRPVKVLELWRVEYNGKVFAYGGKYEPQILRNGNMHGTLEAVRAIFYDIDGNGQFSLMKYSMNLMFLPLEVPDLARKK